LATQISGLTIGFFSCRAQISGPKELYIKAGSELRLLCKVDLGPDGPDEHYRFVCMVVPGPNGPDEHYRYACKVDLGPDGPDEHYR
jgi:hypothetical protein